MTPNDLEVLLYYYCSAGPHPRAEAPAIQETVRRYLEDGILVDAPSWSSGYQVTAKGVAWLRLILAVPYPQQRWVDARTGEPLPDDPYWPTPWSPGGESLPESHRWSEL